MLQILRHLPLFWPTSCWLETNKCSSLANPVLSFRKFRGKGGDDWQPKTRKIHLNLVKLVAEISEDDNPAAVTTSIILIRTKRCYKWSYGAPIGRVITPVTHL